MYSAPTLYFHMSDSGNPTARDIYVPYGLPIIDLATTAGHTQHVEISGITDMYAESGPDFSYVSSYIYQQSTHVGGRDNGVRGDRAHGIEIRNEAWATGNDGFNYHQTLSLDPDYEDGQYFIVDPYTHDNWDDGMSHHERCQATILGGLFEYNGGSGLIPANGAHVSATGAHARKNVGALGVAGLGTGTATGKNAGFAVANATGTDEGGVSTDLALYNCISEDNDRNVYANGDAKNFIRMYGGYVGTATTAKVAAANNAKVYLKDVGEYGTGTTKATAAGGTITVENTTKIT